MNWLSVVIEEYKTLRSESLASMQTQQSILRFGTAAIAEVVATGFNLWKTSPLAEVIFLLFTTTVYLVLSIWMGEIARMMHAGIFLVKLEEKINKEFKDKPKALACVNRRIVLRVKPAFSFKVLRKVLFYLIQFKIKLAFKLNIL